LGLNVESIKKNIEMAKLNLVKADTGEAFEIHDIDFSEVTPNDILRSKELFLPELPDIRYRLAKGSTVIFDENITLKELGFIDDDEIVMVVAKVLYGAPLANSILGKSTQKFSDVIISQY
jgi:hypothetical protein